MPSVSGPGNLQLGSQCHLELLVDKVVGGRIQEEVAGIEVVKATETWLRLSRIEELS